MPNNQEKDSIKNVLTSIKNSTDAKRMSNGQPAFKKSFWRKLERILSKYTKNLSREEEFKILLEIVSAIESEVESSG